MTRRGLDEIDAINVMRERYRALTVARIADEIRMSEQGLMRVLSRKNIPRDMTRYALRNWIEQNMDEFDVPTFDLKSVVKGS